MTYPVFAIRDIKAGFGAPRLAINEEVAKRDFGRDINTPGSALEYAPTDYEFYRIGEYDTATGRFIPAEVNVYLCNGGDVFGR